MFYIYFVFILNYDFVEVVFEVKEFSCYFFVKLLFDCKEFDRCVVVFFFEFLLVEMLGIKVDDVIIMEGSEK